MSMRSLSLSHARRPRPDPIAILRGHTHAVSCATFLVFPDCTNRFLITGDEGGTIRLWDTDSEESVLIHRPPSEGHRSPILSIAQDPAVVTPNLLIHYKTGRVEELCLGRNPFAVDLDAWSVNGTQARTLSTKLPNAFHGALCQSFCKLKFIAPHIWAGPAGDGGEVVVVRDSRAACEVMAALPSPRISQSEKKSGMLVAVTQLKPAGEHPRLLAGYEDGSVAVWDIRAPDNEMSRLKVGKDAITTVVASPFGRVATVAGSFDAVVGVADTEGELGIVKEASLSREGVADLVWSPDGKVVASAGWDGKVRVWDGRRTRDKLLRKIASLRWHEDSASCVAYSADGKLLASGGKDRTVAIWKGVF